MTKTKTARKNKGGPYLAAAFFCESTIEDAKDHALSAIRMVDQFEIVLDPSAPPNFPSEENRLPVALHALLSFKTGDSPGEHTVRIVMESPSGKFGQVFEQTLPFTEQPHGGANLRLNTVVQVKTGGLFWLHVFLDGKRITRMPFQISVRRTEGADTPVGSAVQGNKASRASPGR